MGWRPDVEIVEGTEFELFLMKLAYQEAAKSPDDSTQVGTLVFRPLSQMVVGRGTNRFPPGTDIATMLKDKDLKYANIIHSEDNALRDAGKYAIDSDLIVTWCTCIGCMEKAADAGIRRVYCHAQCVERTREDWRPSLNKAVAYAKERGIEVKLISGQIGGVENLFNRQVWYP